MKVHEGKLVCVYMLALIITFHSFRDIFKKILFAYLFLAVLSLVAVHSLLIEVASVAELGSRVCGPSSWQCVLLSKGGSLTLEHRGSVVVTLVLSCSATCGIPSGLGDRICVTYIGRHILCH